MPQPHHARYSTPFAVLGVCTEGEYLTGVEYLPRGVAVMAPLNRVAERVCRQVERYLADPEFRFDVPLRLTGTNFQRAVWREIARIPSGRTLTYSEMARRLRTAARPVGGACGANPVPLVVPCHRVVASAGLGGFMNARRGSPITIKRWLLSHEGVGLRPD